MFVRGSLRALPAKCGTNGAVCRPAAREGRAKRKPGGEDRGTGPAQTTEMRFRQLRKRLSRPQQGAVPGFPTKKRAKISARFFKSFGNLYFSHRPDPISAVAPLLQLDRKRNYFAIYIQFSRRIGLFVEYQLDAVAHQPVFRRMDHMARIFDRIDRITRREQGQ